MTQPLPPLTRWWFLLLVAAGLVLGGGSLAPSAAHAANIGLTLEGLPQGPVLANGVSVTWVPLLVTDEAGDLLQGDAEVMGVASQGEILDTWSPAPGIFLLRYRPPALMEPQLVTIGVNVTQGNRRGQGQLELRLVPSGRGPIELRAEPDPLQLAEGASSRLTLVTRDGEGAPVTSVSLYVRATEGSVEELRPTDDGRFVATYRPPEGRHPRLALLTAIDASHPDEIYGFHVLPLVGTTRFPVRTTPGVELEFFVRDRQFGPFITDAEGRADVQIEVPPGVSIAEVRSRDVDGVVRMEQLDVSSPPSRMLAALASPGFIPADGEGRHPVRVLVVEPSGAPRLGAPLEIRAERGKVGPVTEMGAGLYQAWYTPPLLDQPATDTVTARLVGEGDLQVERLSMRLTPPGTGAQRVEAAAGGVPLSKAQLAWLNLELSQIDVPAQEASRITVHVRGTSASGLAVPLGGDLVLVSSRGRFTRRRVEADGSLVATLDLPPLPAGEQVAVAVAEPRAGMSNFKLVRAGGVPEASAPPSDASAAAEPASRTSTAEAPSTPADPPPADAPASPRRPPALRTRGTTLYLLAAPGLYTSIQTAEGTGGVLPQGYGINTPSPVGAGAGVDHWVRSGFGVAARYEGFLYGFDTAGRLLQTGKVLTLQHFGSADLRWRLLETPSAETGLGVGVHLGGSGQTYPIFRTVPHEGATAVSFEPFNLMWVGRGGVDLYWLQRGILDLHIGADLGVSLPTLALATRRVEGTAAFQLTPHFALGLAAEAWWRDIPVVIDDTLQGTVEDTWLSGRLFVGLRL